LLTRFAATLRWVENLKRGVVGCLFARKVRRTHKGVHPRFGETTAEIFHATEKLSEMIYETYCD